MPSHRPKSVAPPTKPLRPPTIVERSWSPRWCRIRRPRRATSPTISRSPSPVDANIAHPRETAAFNAKRYKWVKKKMERTDVVPGRGETIVYNLGTLYGEWPDGTPFEGNRYVDRFVVRGGKIVQMDVWNDSAERLLTRHGIDGVATFASFGAFVRLKQRSKWPGHRNASLGDATSG